MRDISFLKKALQLEEETLSSIKQCIEYYQKSGNNEMANIMNRIGEDEKKHADKITGLLKKLEK